MSRRHDTEIVFGSDSFLDVVANIVGILIILIVIAGVRVGQAPVRVKSSPAPALQDPDPPVELAPSVEPPAPPELAATEPTSPPPTPVEEPEPEPLPPLEPPPELVNRVRDLESEIASITQHYRKLHESLTSGHKQRAELEGRLQNARDLLEQRATELNASIAKDADQQHELELARQALARLLSQVQTLERQSPKVEKLEHHITPVSQTVDGHELHYRLEKNRVAEVPLDTLVNRLKDQIERRRDWLAKTNSHQGQVGPVRGFTLQYLIRIEQISTLDELRVGRGGFRISVAQWEIIPEPDLRGETEDAALSQGSRFYESLLAADPDTTLTFWVYPDSYPLYRKLKAFAHEHGFPVAGRPLPDGINIAGSPSGTKSASQ
jgi:hypothetical protein